MKIEITPTMVEQYCELIGDNNPLHKFPIEGYSNQPIAPGLLVTALMTRDPEPNWAVVKLNIKYLEPVFIGDTIEITSRILKQKSKICIREVTINVGNFVKQIIEVTAVKFKS